MIYYYYEAGVVLDLNDDTECKVSELSVIPRLRSVKGALLGARSQMEKSRPDPLRGGSDILSTDAGITASASAVG